MSTQREIGSVSQIPRVQGVSRNTGPEPRAMSRWAASNITPQSQAATCRTTLGVVRLR